MLPPKLRKTEFVAPPGEAIRAFVRGLEIPELSAATALEIVIKAVRDQGFGNKDQEAQEAHAFVRNAWRDARREVEARSKDLGCIPVPTRTTRGRSTSWRRADQVYFSKEWMSTPILEVLYGRFGQPEFLVRTPPRDNVGRRTELALYETLGVASEPRSVRYQGTAHDSRWRQRLAHYAQWLGKSEVKEALLCSEGHPQTARHISFAVLDRLDELLATNDHDVSAALARHLSSTKAPLSRDADIYCMHSTHGGHRRRNRAIGYEAWRLTTTPWIPVRNDPTGASMRPPTEAWSGDRLPLWLMVPQARLKPEAVRWLHVISFDRPGVNAIERALKDLGESFPTLADAPVDVRKSADWLLKRLDRASQRRDDHLGQPPALPCKKDDYLVWSSNPLIGDVVGLGDLPDLDVLPAGDWRGLRRVYGLRRVSEVLTRDLDIGDRVRAPRVLSREKQARLAAVLASKGADEDRVAARLARLRELSVEYIQLRFAYQGHVDLAPVARPFHLEVRHDRSGRVMDARLFVKHPVEPRTLIDIGRDLGVYLDTPDQHASIGLFLTHADAVIASERISDEDIDEAGRRVESHRRKRQDVETEEGGLLDLDEDLPLVGSEAESDAEPDVSSGFASSSGNHNDQAESAHTEGRREAPPLLPPLEHDGVLVTDVVPGTAVVTPTPPESSGSQGPIGSSGRTLDWAELEVNRRLYGRRGEEVAYESERRRHLERGWDPALVRWVARDDEMAPYDIESLNDDGTARYIEVKATIGDDPSEPFQISSAELRFAIEHRSRYFLYRVTAVRAASPQIHWYRDPIGELEARRGYIRTSKAVMALASLDRSAVNSGSDDESGS